MSSRAVLWIEAMEHIWSPWRYTYITQASREPGCVLCRVIEEGDDAKNHVVYRGPLNYVILNLFPYTNGHLMIVPYDHLAALEDFDQATTSEIMELSKRAVKALTEEYHPDGFNVGINLGHCAGAGVAGHLHQHIVPRWGGDANFMSVIGETRILPEDLDKTYERLKRQFGKD